VISGYRRDLFGVTPNKSRR